MKGIFIKMTPNVWPTEITHTLDSHLYQIPLLPNATTAACTFQARGSRMAPPALAHKAGLPVKEISLSPFPLLKGLQ